MVGHRGPGTLERLERRDGGWGGGRAVKEVLNGKPMEDATWKTEGPTG